MVVLDGGKAAIDSDLNQLREEYCLTVVPRTAAIETANLAAIDGCVRVRRRTGALHAVFHSEPEVVRERLRQELGITDAVSTRVPLEDLFVELVGGES